MEKIIEIKRSYETQDRDAVEVAAMNIASVKIIGSYYDKSGNIARGITFEEVEFLMPRILNLPVTDPSFYQKVNEFFRDLTLSIPNTGKKLQVGLSVDNDSPAGAKIKIGKDEVINVPYEPLDYIYYKHCLNHPRVASSKEESDTNITKWFYLYDAQAEEDKELKTLKLRELADANYYQIKTDDTRVKELLLLLGIEYWMFNKAQRVIKLKQLVDSKPEEFIEAFNDNHGKTKVFIKELLRFGIVKELGSRILDANSNDVIGVNIDDAALFLEDNANTDKKRFYEAKLKEATK